MHCPFCDRNVGLKKDGSCPACGNNPDSLSESEKNKAVLSFDINQHTPDTCFECGISTKRRQTFEFIHENPNIAKKFMTSSIFAPLAVLLATFRKKTYAKAYAYVYQLTLPTCKQCATVAKQIKPLENNAGIEYKIRVHKRFKQQFNEMNT